MGKIIENYDSLVAEAAKAYLEPGISKELKEDRRKAFVELSEARNEALKVEHDYNNPAKERVDRIMDFVNNTMKTLGPVAAYMFVSWVSTVLEMGSYIQPGVVKDALRKCKPD